jgi:carbon monoxide dehydrogenase subunit G
VELTHDFSVSVPVEQAWHVLTDLERIAPCMPGAQLTEVEGDRYHGVIKVKVGPITAQYRGTASFVERDADNHVAVLRAEGRDTRGQGTASATVTARLQQTEGGTDVHIDTDLEVSGKVAQFGRGVLADVSAKLLGQFVDHLESSVLAGDADPTTMAAEQPAPAPGTVTAPTEEPAEAARRAVESPEATPVDVMALAGGSMAKRAVPALVALVLVLLGIRRLRRRGGRR